MEKIIRASNVVFSYEQDQDDFAGESPSPPKEVKIVLNNISLDIERGSFVAVLGHNGSGKSTFAKHLNAILLPQEGQVLVEGMNTADDDKLFKIRQTVGMVFQNPDNQIVATIVEDDVAFALENLGVEPGEIRRRVDEALKLVDMYDHRDRTPSQLSGGQKQRVAIAGIIAMRPDCIVMDEPTAMLDPRGRKEVINTIKMLNRDHGITIVLITHYMNEAAQADRVVVMDEGSIILDGSSRQVFQNVSQLQSVGLDVPQATELAYHLRLAHVPLGEDILTVEDCVNEIVHSLSKG